MKLNDFTRAIKKQLNFLNGNQNFLEKKIFTKVSTRPANGLKIKKNSSYKSMTIQFNLMKKKGLVFTGNRAEYSLHRI